MSQLGNRDNKKSVMKKFLAFGLASTAATVGIIGAGYHLIKNATYPETLDYDEHYHSDVEKGYFDEQWFHRLEKEEFYLDSPYGYKLHGYYFPQDSKKTMVIVHGITVSLWSSVKYMKIFIERGYNVIIYDQRNHGLSGGEFTSLGAFEYMDGKRIVDYAIEKDGDDIIIGLHGESMGAATVMMMAGVCKEVDFIIEDCGFTSGYAELTERLKADYSLPSFPLMHISGMMTNRMFGFSLKKDSPVKNMKESNIPVLFIHGGDDTYVPTDMVNELYNAKEDNKEIHVFHGSKHACSYLDNREEYTELVHEFMDKYGF